ncbi:MAG: T9SS type A sorting domain-containing protein [Cyclobacteriaceae bacterium]
MSPDTRNSHTLSNFSPNAIDGGQFAWGDYDNDGFTDLVISSVDRYPIELYRNVNGVFSLVDIGWVYGTNGGNLDWADYDGDGDLDLIVSRSTSLSDDSFLLKFYENDEGVFTSRTDVGLPLKLSHRAIWGDYDQDGDPDLAVIVEDDLNEIRGEIYNNHEGFFTNIGASLPLASEGSLAWGDYDNDDDLDLLITGYKWPSSSAIYRNDEGTFVDIEAGLAGVSRGSAAWGDYDDDGDLDIVLTGSAIGDLTPTGVTPSAHIYRNNGDQTFTNIEADLLPVLYSSSAWGDYDNDGDLDLVIAGFTDWFAQEVDSKLYINEEGVFVESDFELPAVEYGNAYWVDYDNDSDDDLFFTGDYFPAGSAYTRILYKNTSVANVWDGATWSDGATPDGEDVRIAGDYSSAVHGSFVAGNLEVLSEVTLTVGGNNTLTVNCNLINDGAIIVESGSSLITYAENIVADNITIQRNTRYADGKYSFVGSPVEQSANTVASDLGDHVYTYDEALSAVADDLARWQAAQPSDQLTPGQGYTQANQKLIEFVGKPNAGTITYSGSYQNDGWHLVSNPYAAAIFIDDFLDANTHTTDAIYIWDDNGSDAGRGSSNDYIVANKTAATDISGENNKSRWNEHIGSAQGFFVQLDGSAGDITFTEEMRVSGSNGDGNFFRHSGSETPLLRLSLTHADGLIRQAVIGWNEAVSNSDIAEGYDAKVFNPDADYLIYTCKANSPLAIQTVNSEATQITIGFNVAEAGNYNLKFGPEHLSQTWKLYDKAMDMTIDMSVGAYSFYTEAGQITDRFTISTAAEVLGMEDEQVSLYAANKILFIKTEESQPKLYRIYDLSGHGVFMAVITGSAVINLSHISNGVYIVSDGIESKKIILK